MIVSHFLLYRWLVTTLNIRPSDYLRLCLRLDLHSVHSIGPVSWLVPSNLNFVSLLVSGPLGCVLCIIGVDVSIRSPNDSALYNSVSVLSLVSGRLLVLGFIVNHIGVLCLLIGLVVWIVLGVVVLNRVLLLQRIVYLFSVLIVSHCCLSRCLAFSVFNLEVIVFILILLNVNLVRALGLFGGTAIFDSLFVQVIHSHFRVLCQVAVNVISQIWILNGLFSVGQNFL